MAEGMTPLSGLELRRRVCELIGWTRGNRFWHHPWCSEDSGCVNLCGGKDDESLPKYEADASLSEALLDKVCAEKGCLWSLDTLGDAYECEIRGGSERYINVSATGKDPSEARCRAIVEALTNNNSTKENSI